MPEPRERTERHPVLPECDVCDVEHVEGYEGPCSEFASWATERQLLSENPPRCPGTVSYRATAERLAAELERVISG